jgi:hypothetical protein
MMRHIDPSLEHMTCKSRRTDFVPDGKRAQFKPFYWKKMININRRKARAHRVSRKVVS